MRQLVSTPVPAVPQVTAGMDLLHLTREGLRAAGITLQSSDVLVFASKIVAKAEGRTRRLREVQVSPAAQEIAAVCGKDPRLVELILAESNHVLRIRPGLLIVEHRLGFVCANAGIDHSNTSIDEDIVLLLPLDPDRSAKAIWAGLKRELGVDVAVVINDSHGRAWRLGTVGIAIGVAGMAPLTDLRGESDMFGRTLEVTVLATADEIAAAASLMQGGAGERSPIIHLRGVPYRRGDDGLAHLLRPHHLDTFR